MGIFLWGCLNFKNNWGIPVIPDIFGVHVNSRCWVQAYAARIKMRVPPSSLTEDTYIL